VKQTVFQNKTVYCTKEHKRVDIQNCFSCCFSTKCSGYDIARMTKQKETKIDASD